MHEHLPQRWLSPTTASSENGAVIEHHAASMCVYAFPNPGLPADVRVADAPALVVDAAAEPACAALCAWSPELPECMPTLQCGSSLASTPAGGWLARFNVTADTQHSTAQHSTEAALEAYMCAAPCNCRGAPVPDGHRPDGTVH